MSHEPRDPLERFDDELRRWATRPSHRTPARAAAEIKARIAGRRARSPMLWRWAAIAAAALLVVGLAWRWRLTSAPEPPVQVALREELDLPPLDPDVALIWLDTETPLYLTLTPPAEGGGDLR